MRRNVLPFALAVAAVAFSGCERREDGNAAADDVQTDEAREAAGEETIAAGLDQNSRFVAAAKAAGLDATLAGPGPYTVLVPTDAAFNKLPAGRFDEWMRPESRAELTGVLTYHVLPGLVLAEDFRRAIDNSNGRAVLATMGGETVTAARDGDRIVLTDGAGGRAVITQADVRRSNGVVHQIDTVLMPGEGAGAAEGEAPPQQ
jgi:uncharacterized surface protein with fasciclin (FAS1) repeats